MSDVIQDWVEQLLVEKSDHWTHRIPAGVAFITCQVEACVIAKSSGPIDTQKPGEPGSMIHPFRGN